MTRNRYVSALDTTGGSEGTACIFSRSRLEDAKKVKMSGKYQPQSCKGRKFTKLIFDGLVGAFQKWCYTTQPSGKAYENKEKIQGLCLLFLSRYEMLLIFCLVDGPLMFHYYSFSFYRQLLATFQLINFGVCLIEFRIYQFVTT